MEYACAPLNSGIVLGNIVQKALMKIGSPLATNFFALWAIWNDKKIKDVIQAPCHCAVGYASAHACTAFSRMEYACAPLNTEQILFETVEKLKIVLKKVVIF
jgi:hypothetical protein